MIERHSKVFVPVSVENTPHEIKVRFMDSSGRIYTGNYSQTSKCWYAYDFNEPIQNVIHWLEEKENVYVLSEQELKDLLLEFSKETDTYHGFVIVPDRIYEPRIEQFIKSKIPIAKINDSDSTIE